MFFQRNKTIIATRNRIAPTVKTDVSSVSSSSGDITNAGTYKGPNVDKDDA